LANHHAIVIGIDGYVPEAWKLGGAVRDALAFTRWLISTGGVPAANLHLLLSPAPGDVLPALPEGVAIQGPATSQGIVDAIADCQNAGGGERLYFYYAGHGASLPHWRPEPILIPVDFSNPQTHGLRLIGFSMVVPALATAPFAEQLFLIDACRDFGLEGYQPPAVQGTVGAFQLPAAQAGNRPRQYVFYGVAPGQRAVETGRGIWTGTLLEGLGSRSYQVLSRGRNPDGTTRYEVRMDQLAEWVRGRIRERIDRAFPSDAGRYVQTPEYVPDPQGGDPLLTTYSVEAAPRVQVEVLVEPALAHRTCKLAVMQYVDGLGREIEVAVSGPPVDPPTAFMLLPSDYSFRAQADRYVLRSKPWTVTDEPVVELTLEEDRTPAFSPPASRGEISRGGLVFGVAGAPQQGTLIVTSPDRQARIEVLDGKKKVVLQAVHSLQASLAPGIYRVRLRLPGATPVEQAVEVRAGRPTRLELALPDPKLGDFQLRLLQDLGIVTYLPNGKMESVQPSERLGPVGGARLGSLLAFAVYASHQPEGFAKLRGFGIQPVTLAEGESCALLALVGAADGGEPANLAGFLADCRLAVRRLDGTEVTRGGFETLSGMPAAAQRRAALAEPGSLQAELRMPGFAHTRYALAALPGRLTVFIAVAEKNGTVDVQQYLFPLRAAAVPELLGPEYLDDPQNVRRLEIAQAFYATGDTEQVLGEADLGDLLLGKWLDPLLSCIAGYSLARAGQPERFVGDLERGGDAVLEDPEGPAALDARGREPGPSALVNLLVFFPELPDVHVLAGLCDPRPERRAGHFGRALDRGLPIFAEGIRALANASPSPLLKEPMASLLPGSPWTGWASLQPVLTIRSGRFEEPPPSWRGALEERRPAIEESLRAVGRIEVEGHPYRLPWVGTGFLVAPDLVMMVSYAVSDLLAPSLLATSVLATPLPHGDPGHEADDPAVRGLELRPGVSLRIDFREELDQTEAPAEFELLGVVAMQASLRLALLRVAPVSRDGSLSLPKPLALAQGEPGSGVIEGRLVYVAGYPAQDPRVDPTVIQQALGQTYDVKRLQPGELLAPPPSPYLVHHDCFTTGGNGGAPLIDLASGAVIGLHHGGRAGYKEATALWRLAEHDLFTGAGVEWRAW
jgi:hypothetical protein